MERYDYLVRGTACNEQIRFFAADTTAVVQTAMQLHKLAPAPALLLGRMLTSAILMGADLKSEFANLSLNIEADGPLKGAIAIYEPRGKVKGYAKKPHFFHEDIKENWQIGKLLGKGTLSVIRDMKLKAPMIGTTQLVSGEVGDDIASYYLNSEQIPTAISVGVLFDREGAVRSAGGYLIQQLPFAEESMVEKLMHNLSMTPYITDLLDMGTDLQTILSQFVFKDLEWTKHDLYPVEYACSCSRDKFADALRLLGRDELLTLQDGISPVCHYCNKVYEFNSADLESILASLPEE